MDYLVSLINFYIQDQQDKSLINWLIKEENEFLFAAFDVFKSDKD